MFPPIRPSPTIAICIVASDNVQGLVSLASVERGQFVVARAPQVPLVRFEPMNAEEAPLVAPNLAWNEARLPGERVEGFNRVFVRILRVNRLAVGEVHEVLADADALTLTAQEIHLDARRRGVVE